MLSDRKYFKSGTSKWTSWIVLWYWCCCEKHLMLSIRRPSEKLFRVLTDDIMVHRRKSGPWEGDGNARRVGETGSVFPFLRVWWKIRTKTREQGKWRKMSWPSIHKSVKHPSLQKMRWFSAMSQKSRWSNRCCKMQAYQHKTYKSHFGNNFWEFSKFFSILSLNF